MTVQKEPTSGQTTAKPRCPKCRSVNFMAYAQDEVEASAPVIDGEVSESWATSALGSRVALYGECDCGHRWRFRDRNAL